MKTHLNRIEKVLKSTKEFLKKNTELADGIDLSMNFIPPFSKSIKVSDVKLIIIGQDPTVRNKTSRKNIQATLNLDKNNSLRKYVEKVCKKLHFDIDKEVYATNLYKCFFTDPPSDNPNILTRHFKIWMDILIDELRVFDLPYVVTLGEPVIQQLVYPYAEKNVKFYWNYTGNTNSGCKFKSISQNDNYLQKKIYPIPHQPTYSKNFYKKYFDNYLNFIIESEKCSAKR